MYAPLHVSSGFIYYYFSGKGKHSLQTVTLLVMAKLSKPQLKNLCKPFAFSSLQVLSLVFSSSSLHFFSLISRPHIFLFHLNYLLLLVTPSTSRPPLYFL